jgi:molybdopterin synthase sulfur carrier subunit
LACIRVPDTPAAADTDTAGETKSITILYFISLVTRLGRESETCDVPASVRTVGELLAWLRERGATWESLLQDSKVNVTVNKKFAKPDTLIENNDEIAIVPANPL